MRFLPTECRRQNGVSNLLSLIRGLSYGLLGSYSRLSPGKHYAGIDELTPFKNPALNNL